MAMEAERAPSAKVLGTVDNPDGPLALHTPPTQNVLETENPPEPYSQLMPGTPILEGDIMKNLGTGETWAPVTAASIGKQVPAARIVVARLQMPEHYRPVTDHEVLWTRDLCWRTTRPSWEPVDPIWTDTTLPELRLKYPKEAFYACRPEFDPGDAREIDPPAHHRELAPGEKVRRGDKMIYLGIDKWQVVEERLRGSIVPASEDSNHFVRYSRPVHHQSMTWYVDPTGEADALGGPEDPFPDLDTACHRIEKSAEQLNRAPHGVIRTLKGAPLLAYDLPEPPAPPPPPSPFTHTLDPPEGCVLRKAGDVIQATDLVELRGEWTAAEAMAGLPVDGHRIARKKGKPPTNPFPKGNNRGQPPAQPVAANFAPWPEQSITWITQQMGLSRPAVVETLDAMVPEGFRQLAPEEEIRDGDAMAQLTKFNQSYSFQDIPARMLRMEVGDFYVIRKRAPGGLDAMRQRLAQMEQQVAAMMQELQELKRTL